mmetsp:Transcript_3197/g.4433  ORF Transcript_3197/g.4433 Transcript_3197/m.4433 type:complete len:255 (+) Transcript_3197:99-863(+)
MSQAFDLPRTTNSSKTHRIEIRDDGRLYTYANYSSGNRFGQLGIGRSDKKVEIGKEFQVILPNQVISAATGGSKESGHTLCVTKDNKLYAFGCDRWQQLGLGSLETGSVGYTWQAGRLWQTTPQHVRALDGVEIFDVACGDEHSVALSKNGDVFCFGRGNKGQLEEGRSSFVGAPRRCVALSATDKEKPMAISAAADCSCAWFQRITTSSLEKTDGAYDDDFKEKESGRFVCIGTGCSRLAIQMEAILREKLNL